MDFQLGPVLIGLAGAAMLIGAVMQARQALSADFMKHIAGQAPGAIATVGRAGYAAHEVVFAIIGWSLMRAGWFSNEAAVKGIGESLVSLRDKGAVYTLVAIGLLLFGAFSLVVARYRVIPDFHRSDLKPDLHRPHV